MESNEEKQARIDRCLTKINQVLKEEYCFLEPVICFVGNKKILAEVKVYASSLPVKGEEPEQILEETPESVVVEETPKVEEVQSGTS